MFIVALPMETIKENNIWHGQSNNREDLLKLTEEIIANYDDIKIVITNKLLDLYGKYTLWDVDLQIIAFAIEQWYNLWLKQQWLLSEKSL